MVFKSEPKKEEPGKPRPVEQERTLFRSLILQNPNFFGNLKGSAFKSVKSVTSNTTYEELKCVGFHPQLNRLEAVVSSHFHAYAPVRIDLVPSAFDTTWPGPGFFVHGLFNAVVFAAGAAVLIYLARLSLVRRAWWLWLGGLLLLVSLGPAGAHSVAEFLLGWAMGLVSLVAVVGIVYAFFRDNVLAYLAAALCLEVAEPVVALLSQPPAFFRWNGTALVALTAVVLGWLLLPTRQSQTSS